MRHAHGGVGLVDVLAARAGGAVGVNPDVLHVDFDLPVVLQHRRHVQGSEGGVPPGVGVEGADANQAMDALFPAQVAVGVVPVHLEGNGLDARLVALQVIQQRDLETHFLTVAHVHPVEHLRPVLGFGAARAGVEGQHGVALVIIPAHQRFQRQRVHMAAQPGQLVFRFAGGGLVVFLLRQLDHHLQVVPLAAEVVIMADFPFQGRNPLVDVGGTLHVIPKAGRGHFLAQLNQLALHQGDVQPVPDFLELFPHLPQALLDFLQAYNHAFSFLIARRRSGRGSACISSRCRRGRGCFCRSSRPVSF